MDFEDIVEEKMERFERYLASIDGAKRILLEDALRDYCYTCAQLEEINKLVREVGYTITNKQGNIVRNPDVMTQHQLMNEKNALLPKILKHIESESSNDNDELLSFLGK